MRRGWCRRRRGGGGPLGGGWRDSLLGLELSKGLVEKGNHLCQLFFEHEQLGVVGVIFELRLDLVELFFLYA